MMGRGLRCPMCGTDMAAEHRGDHEDAATIRAKIAGLEERLGDLQDGIVTPREMKDRSLWMCAVCQAIMGDVPGAKLDELDRRIRDEIGRLGQRLELGKRRAS